MLESIIIAVLLIGPVLVIGGIFALSFVILMKTFRLIHRWIAGLFILSCDR